MEEEEEEEMQKAAEITLADSGESRPASESDASYC
jgi:hypothetical protein